MYLTNSRKLSIHRFAFLPLFEMYRSCAPRILISTSYILIESERIWNYIVWNIISNNMALPVSIARYVHFIIISKICESSFHRFSVSELPRLFHDKNFVDIHSHTDWNGERKDMPFYAEAFEEFQRKFETQNRRNSAELFLLRYNSTMKKITTRALHTTRTMNLTKCFNTTVPTLSDFFDTVSTI